MSQIFQAMDNKSIKETRDLLEKLLKEIQESNKASANLNTTMLWLTGVGVTIAVIEFITKLLPIIYG